MLCRKTYINKDYFNSKKAETFIMKNNLILFSTFILCVVLFENCTPKVNPNQLVTPIDFSDIWDIDFYKGLQKYRSSDNWYNLNQESPLLIEVFETTDGEDAMAYDRFELSKDKQHAVVQKGEYRVVLFDKEKNKVKEVIWEVE